MNCVDHDILTCLTFRGLPVFNRVSWAGFLDEKVMMFDAEGAEGSRRLFVLNVIRQEDKDLWDSSHDLLQRSVTAAALRVRGVFRLDMWSFDMHREILTFRDHELTTLIANLSRRLAPGQNVIVKYSSFYGLLTKLSVEDWGKVILRTPVDTFAKSPAQLDLLCKRLLRLSGTSPAPAMLVINDLSQTPLLDAADDEQRKRLQKLWEGRTDLFQTMPEVVVQDKNGTHELSQVLGQDAET